MSVTTWDGHLRIDHLVDTATVAMTLLTVEPIRQAQLRTGLVVGFVTGDPHGPPASVAFVLRDTRIPDDVAVLLGRRVSAAVTELLGTGRSGEWLQLDLIEVDDLAAAWGPYRAMVMTADTPGPQSIGTLGAWAEDLWTCFGLPRWSDALQALGGPQPVFRGSEGEGPSEDPVTTGLRGTWRLPNELATAAGVAPDVAWTMLPAAEGTVHIDFEVRRTDQPAPGLLQVGLDDEAQRWVSFDAHPAGGLRARLVGPDGPLQLRFRSKGRNPA